MSASETVLAINDSKLYPPSSGSGKPTLQHPNQRQRQPTIDTWVKLPVDNVSSAVFGGSEVELSYLLRDARIHSIKDIVLQFRITNSVAASYYIPASQFTTEIEIVANSGSGSVIQTFWPESQWALLGSIPDEDREAELHAQGFAANAWQDAKYQMAVSQTRNFEHKLLGGFWNNLEMDMAGALSEGLRFVFRMRSSIVSSGGGTATLNAMNIYVRQQGYQDPNASALQDKTIAASVLRGNYLDSLKLSFVSQTLTASNETQITLSNLNRFKVAALIVGIRASPTAVASQGIIDYLPLDDADANVASLDLSAPGAKSLFSNGSPIDIGTLKRIVGSRHLSSKFLDATNLYLIPFTESVKKSLMGEMKGFLQVMDDHYTLDIVPGAAAASEVQTLTGAAAASAGFYSFEFMGQLSQPVAFDATVAQLKAAFEAIPSVINYPGGISVTFGGQLDAAATATVTFADSRSYPLIKVVAHATAAGAVQYTTTRTTKGNGGWTTASTYNVDVEALIWREFILEDGRIQVRNL